MENEEPSYCAPTSGLECPRLNSILKNLNKFKIIQDNFKPFLVILLVSVLTFWAWHALNPAYHPKDWRGVINGVSYSPFQKDQSPLEKKYPTGLNIDSDMRLLKDKVSSVRIYSSTDGSQLVPQYAKRYNLAVTAGAWLSKNHENNEKEIENLIQLVKSNDNIERVIVGNEAILRDDLSIDELISYIKRVKKEVNVPVSAAETWDVWLKHRELAQNVDFIAIHVLPIWENIPTEKAVDYVMSRYNEIKRIFPEKHVLLAEVGWPSAKSKYNILPGLINQATFVREMLSVASKHSLDYFVIEAIDQPWKIYTEGVVGPNWGLFDKNRIMKFPFTGSVFANINWKYHACLAIFLAIFPIFFFSKRFQGRINFAGLFFFSSLIELSASFIIWTIFLPQIEPMPFAAKVMWGMLIPAQFLLFAVLLINGFETTEALWIKKWRRFFNPIPKDEVDREKLQKVSIHLAICNEPPEMVIQTLNSLSNLDYPDYEVIIVDNNTKDEKIWKPVETYCQRLGDKFKFFHLPKWPGFKAGALNFALKKTHQDAKYIAVIDSDYVVDPDWLISLVPYFNNEKVGFVQAPQDHRDWNGDLFKSMCNWEFSGFFHIGMQHRNERNAIIQHGTMTIIRKTVIDEMNGWSEWCICEDAELGLKIMHKGYEAVYVNHAFGKGLTPDNFDGFRKQRFRWVYGAIQIIKKYWKWMVPFVNKDSGLSTSQRYHFISGWLPWFADAVHFVFTIFGIIWTLGMVFLPGYFQFSFSIFVIPTVLAFVFKVVNSLVLYNAKVPCTLGQSLLSSIAGMSVTHVIGKAVIQGILTDNQPFYRTPKCEKNQGAIYRGLLMAKDELIMFSLIWFAILNLALRHGFGNINLNIWATVLAIQSIPYLAAVTSSLINTMPAFSLKSIKIPVPAQLQMALQPEKISNNKY
jgi:exo-beta-1,3-glucanase (GH17 family)/cellulose synthase/poly-beta-1,6-N-acetylglucosamine synthase-like glycosyltransferase